MSRNALRKLAFVKMIMLVFSQMIYAQPYLYRMPDHDWGTQITRINLQTGMSELFTQDTFPKYSGVSADPTQTWLYVTEARSGPIIVINCNNPLIRDSLPHHEWPYGMRDIEFYPQFNKFCVEWTDDWGEGQRIHYGVYDASSFALLDTLPLLDRLRPLKALSEDGTMFFTSYVDTIANRKYEQIFSTATKTLIRQKALIDIGPPTNAKYLDDVRNGRILYGYLYPEKKTADGQYLVYDIVRDTVFPIIPDPQISKAFLSHDGKLLVIEETPLDKTRKGGKSDPKHVRTGRMSIYDVESGKLVQKLFLPQNGDIYLFDNFPNKFYYYIESESRSINIDLSRLVTIASLDPFFAYAGSSAFTLTVKGKNFVSGSSLYWNGTAKTTTFISDTLLQASILASDIAAIDSPLVTVKNPDGSAESNGICFYIKQPPPITGCNVKLVNSTGAKLTGGALQYYEGSWKDAVNNNDGTFFVSTSAKTISLRMTYEYGTQTKSNVTVGPDTVAFQTVNTQIKLQDSKGNAIDTGSVQYYAGAWRVLGTTTNGIANKELLPVGYSFRMTYAYASNDKQQDLSTNSTVIFQTVNAAVQLQNSQGTLIDQGTVQYYSGAWRDFGTTTGGVASKELLPNNYLFRMTYAYASKDKQQDIGTNATVVFQTVNAAVQLQNSQGTLMDQGTVQYYSGAWRDFGTTSNGIAAKELLPNTYSFRMTYAYANKDKQQDISTNATVVFQTVNAAVQLQNSRGTLIDQGTVQYYSGAWRDFGTTTNGIAAKELLPNTYSFRMTYAYASKDKQQDISANPTVVFQTVNVAVQLKNSQGNLIDQGTVQYYSGAWRSFGTTSNGIAAKELLPNTYSFRMTYEYVSLDKSQDISVNNTVGFSTVLCTIRVKNSQSQPVDGATASYYSGAWRQIGNTVNGEVTKELLPATLTFRVTYSTTQQDKTQNLSTSNVVEFTIGP